MIDSSKSSLGLGLSMRREWYWVCISVAAVSSMSTPYFTGFFLPSAHDFVLPWLLMWIFGFTAVVSLLRGRSIGYPGFGSGTFFVLIALYILFFGGVFNGNYAVSFLATPLLLLVLMVMVPIYAARPEGFKSHGRRDAKFFAGVVIGVLVVFSFVLPLAQWFFWISVQ